MTSIRVTHTIDDLESDMRTLSRKGNLYRHMRPVVVRNVRLGKSTTRTIAKSASGPHGKAYYKRITSGMTGPLVGEWGPTGVVDHNAVGAGWRHGVNTDLEKSQDVVGPKFAADVRAALGEMFWPS